MFQMVVEYLQDMRISWYNKINTLNTSLQRDSEKQPFIRNKVKLQTKQSSRM